MKLQSTHTPTGAGDSAAQCLSIEWAYGLCEKFDGTLAEAERKIMAMGLRDDGEVIKKQRDYGQDFYEYCLQPHGMDWAFVARVYQAA